jgi:hypothetical protein
MQSEFTVSRQLLPEFFIFISIYVNINPESDTYSGELSGNTRTLNDYINPYEKHQ